MVEERCTLRIALPYCLTAEFFKIQPMPITTESIKLVSSNADIEDCVFQDNHSLKNSGGAILLMNPSVPVLKNNQFYQNSSQSWGGAIYCKNTDLNVSGGIFLDNWSEFGGGVATNGTSEVNFENLKILGNESNASSSARGGFLYLGSNAVNSNL